MFWGRHKARGCENICRGGNFKACLSWHMEDVMHAILYSGHCLKWCQDTNSQYCTVTPFMKVKTQKLFCNCVHFDSTSLFELLGWLIQFPYYRMVQSTQIGSTGTSAKFQIQYCLWGHWWVSEAFHNLFWYFVLLTLMWNILLGGEASMVEGSSPWRPPTAGQGWSSCEDDIRHRHHLLRVFRVALDGDQVIRCWSWSATW